MLGRIRRPSPALVVAIIALIVSLTGTAWAALGKNSVGSRQLKSKAVTTGKIANNAITGAKVASHTLTGTNINLSQLGTVPSATEALTAGAAGALIDGSERHPASCPPETRLIRGLCYDTTLSKPVAGIFAASEACTAKGGYLPTPMELYSVHGVIFLGSGAEPDFAVADDYFADPGTGSGYRTMTVDNSGHLQMVTPESSTKYICVYPLVR